MHHDMIAITAEVVAREGHEAKAAELLAGLAAATSHHAGVLRYEVQRQSGNPRVFMVVELWADRASLEAHKNTEDMRCFIEAAPAVLEGAWLVREWQGVAASVIPEA